MILETEIRIFYEEFNGVQKPSITQRLIVFMSEIIGVYELETDEQYKESMTRIILKSGVELRILLAFDEFYPLFKKYTEQNRNNFLTRLN